jgi:hypothetical protein
LKKTILLISFVFLVLLTKSQNLRCIAATSFIHLTEKGDITINKPIAVCFTDNYFSLSSPECGTISFKIDGISRRVDKDGSPVLGFFNEENGTNMRMDYSVEVVFGITKTIMISFTRFGDAYVIESNNFIGSMETEQSSNSLIDKNVQTIKDKSSENNNLKNHAKTFVKPHIETNGESFKVGDQLGGGFVIYVDSTNKHGTIIKYLEGGKSLGINKYNGIKLDRSDSLYSTRYNGAINTELLKRKYENSDVLSYAIDGWYIPSIQGLESIIKHYPSNPFLHSLYHGVYLSSTEGSIGNIPLINVIVINEEGNSYRKLSPSTDNYYIVIMCNDF